MPHATLRRARAPAFHPEGGPNVKPPGQNHMCSHKWQVVYGLGTVYLTLSPHRMYQGKRMPYIFVQGLVRPLVGVVRIFNP